MDLHAIIASPLFPFLPLETRAMSTPSSQTSAQPEAALSDWFGVEVRRPADAPPPGSARDSNATDSAATSAYPGTNPYPTRPISRPIPAHDLDDIPAPRSNHAVIGALMLGAGLLLMVVTYNMGGGIFISIGLMGGGLVRLITGLSED